MARIAFYAPMKSPLSPVPSGDREMARNLMRMIGAQGDTVELVSEFRSHDKGGNVEVQTRLRAEAEAEIARLCHALPEDCALWVTYHNYYKAPDLIGPAVCAARGLPYVQIESTRATSRLTGPWAGFAQAAHDACDVAQVIFYLTANDLITLDRERFGAQKLVELPPFLPLDQLPPEGSRDGPILTVGMMRQGDKMASYGLIAQTLQYLDGDWNLEIAGDGPARPEIERLMAPFGSRVRFLGQLDRAALQSAYDRASVFFWPGVNEAFGMVYLEAQAAGLPVVAQDRPGVRDVLLPGPAYPAPEAGAGALAAVLNQLRRDPLLRKRIGALARRRISERHLIDIATGIFWQAAGPLMETRA
ncbi:glycosyltransferase family 4 protein [Ruegeria marina]|uniref:Glycosyltransferase involved in cell wall bisynthesis n=1 Tax=Ruegeria marina TaxID=639004 RepID=A0A1G7CPJ2_9RHOB|nr:glycosyltransferase family 4 protein [Ruegeria marina]SDE40385.1 Glycosyltransferase involved in cell wall bisynthesis [Ruegeria marina]